MIRSIFRFATNVRKNVGVLGGYLDFFFFFYFLTTNNDILYCCHPFLVLIPELYVYLTLPIYFLETCVLMLLKTSFSFNLVIPNFFLEISVSVQVFHLRKYL